MTFDRENVDLEEKVPSQLATEHAKSNSIFFKGLLCKSELGERPPIIVCGLPRSGSSLLSDLLTQTGAYYVFDDLYLKRKVDELGYHGVLNPKEIRELLEFLGWQIRARIRFKPYSTPKMKQSDVEKMNFSILNAFTGIDVDWVLLQKEWLVRLAKLNGCSGWGFNYPAAIRDIATYNAMYPNPRFVFLHRSPDHVMSSYKHMPKGHNDGDPDRYHPVVYALYWKVAARNYFNFKRYFPARIVAVKFSDMIVNPEKEIKAVGAAFGFTFENCLKLIEANSSFKKKKKDINGLENAILKIIAGKYMKELSYSSESRPIKLSDFFDILTISFRFLRFKFCEKFDKG